MNIIKLQKVWFTISLASVALCIVALSVFGLNLGIDFKGGVGVDYKWNDGNRLSVNDFRREIEEFNLTDAQVQLSGEDGISLKTKSDTLNSDTRELILKKLNGGELNSSEAEQSENGSTSSQDLGPLKVEEASFELIGPTIGKELLKKSIWSLVFVVIGIVLYVAYAFRKVGHPVASWKYGVAAVVALIHDIIIVMGVFAVLGRFMNVEINTLFIVALLTILGYSVNDTVVVFDRIRDNLHKDDNFENAVENGVESTMARSLNTTITTLVALFALYIFGGETIKWFVLALIIGIASGAYSSIFFASPFLVFWNRYAQKKALKQ